MLNSKAAGNWVESWKTQSSHWWKMGERCFGFSGSPHSRHPNWCPNPSHSGRKQRIGKRMGWGIKQRHTPSLEESQPRMRHPPPQTITESKGLTLGNKGAESLKGAKMGVQHQLRQRAQLCGSIPPDNTRMQRRATVRDHHTHTCTRTHAPSLFQPRHPPGAAVKQDGLATLGQIVHHGES